MSLVILFLPFPPSPLSCSLTPLCDPQAHFCQTLRWKLRICHQNTWKCGSKILRLFRFKENFIFIHTMYEKFTYTDYILLTVHGLDAGDCVPRAPDPFQNELLCLFPAHVLAQVYTLCAWNVQQIAVVPQTLILKLTDPFEVHQNYTP